MCTESKAIQKFVVLLWCRDCFGEDFQGCFDGGDQYHEQLFDSEQEAIEYARETNYSYEIYQLVKVNEGL